MRLAKCRVLTIVTTCIALALGTSTGAFAQGGFLVTDLGAGMPTGINGFGQVIGVVPQPDGSELGVLWTGGAVTFLGSLGGPSTIPYGINDLGQIVGQSQTGSGEWHAFIWNSGVITDLGLGAASAGTDVNNSGRVIGMIGSSAFTLDTTRNRPAQILPPLSLIGETRANDINNAGQIIGTSTGTDGLPHAVIWEKTPSSRGQYVPVEVFGLGAGSGKCLNEAGAACVDWYTPRFVMPMLWRELGLPVYFGMPHGFRDGLTYGLNTAGQALVEAIDYNRAGVVTRRKIYLAVPLGGGYRSTDLSRTLSLLRMGGVLDNRPPALLNDLGQITGGTVAPGGALRALLLTPTP